jgi:parallel beta-helix repeat protein
MLQGLSVSSLVAAEAPAGPVVQVADFLPAGYVTDGSVSYQTDIQSAIDAARARRQNVVFGPLTYRLDDPAGLRIPSGLTLDLRGTTFLLAPEIATDGQAFLGGGVHDVTFLGGSIVGRNDVWPSGINVRGIHFTGECRNIRVEDMTIRDLSSNGVGVFGTDPDHPARDVWVIDSVIDNCCNYYGDYQAPPPVRRGPEAGSTREDQGSVCFYHVEDFVVRGCRFEDSRSDGTHFYKCRQGHFSDNRVYRAQMGGYFIETCEHVLAANNIIRDNGSRGVTIERGCRACTLIGNTVEASGREGLWMPDCSRCVVTNNLFLRNGRKENGTQPQNIWDANVTINESRGDPSNSPAEFCVVSHNLFDTGADQIAAIRVVTEDSVRGVVIEGNTLTGENREIIIAGEFPDRVTVRENDARAADE